MEKRDDEGKIEESDEDAIETFELNEELITNFELLSIRNTQIDPNEEEEVINSMLDFLISNNVVEEEEIVEGLLELLGNELNSMVKVDLVALCKDLKIAHSGNMQTLRKRILNFHEKDLGWETPDADFQFKPRVRNHFLNHPNEIDSNSTPFQIFSHFFNEEYVELFAAELTRIIKVYPRRGLESIKVDKYLVYGYLCLVLETSWYNLGDLKIYHDLENTLFSTCGIPQNIFLQLTTALWHLSVMNFLVNWSNI